MTEISRPPHLDDDKLSQEQKAVAAAILTGPRGVVEGPLRVWLQSPQLADKAQALGAHCRYGSQLPPRLSELAILVTGGFWKAGFEWAVHAPIALESGVSAEVATAIRKGDKPSFEHEDEAIVYAFADELHRTHHVSKRTYSRAVEILGTAVVVDLVGILGYYTLISMTINAFHVPLPKGCDDPFA